jgi:nuclear pore complex protein Nup153
VLSSTAKRILDLMNQYSSPLQEARKIGSHLSTGTSVSNLPGLVQQRARFSEEDVKLSRSIRLNTPRTPYSRPLVSARDPDASLKLLSTPNTNELQVPQISQLLKMKRLQYNTEQVRQMAATSKSSLNKEIPYRLPTDSANALGEPVEQVKQQSKMKTKVSKTRPSVRDVAEEAPEVALPDIRLPVMKTMPSFGLTATAKVTTPPAFGQKLQETPAVVKPPLPPVAAVIPAAKTIAPLNPKPFAPSKPPPSTTLETNFKFSSPLTDISTYAGGAFASSNFKFSDPIMSNESALSSISNDSLRKSNANTLPPPPVSLQQPFTFDPSTAKLKEPSVATKLRMTDTPQTPPTLKSGSVMDFLKASTSTSASPTGDAGFKKLLAAQNSKWECASCMTRNDNTATKCLCCETPKAGAASSAPSQSLFKLPATAGSGDAGE